MAGAAYSHGSRLTLAPIRRSQHWRATTRHREAFRAAHAGRCNEDEEVVHIWSRWEAKTRLQWREMMKYCTYTLHGVTRRVVTGIKMRKVHLLLEVIHYNHRLEL